MTWRLGLQSTPCVRCLASSGHAAAQHPHCPCACMKLISAQEEDLQGWLGRAAQCWMWLTPGDLWQGQLPGVWPGQLPQGKRSTSLQ